MGLNIHIRPIFIGLFIVLNCFNSVGAEEGDNTATERAREILRQVDDMWRGLSSHAIFTMQVKTLHYTRSMRLEAWSKGKEQTLVRILSPLKEKGTATLKSSNNIYKIGRAHV